MGIHKRNPSLYMIELDPNRSQPYINFFFIIYTIDCNDDDGMMMKTTVHYKLEHDVIFGLVIGTNSWC